MSDELDRKAALKKQRNFITPNNVLLSYFMKLQEFCGNFYSSYETKKSSMEKVMRIMLEEVIMSDVGWTNIFIFATFCQH